MAVIIIGFTSISTLGEAALALTEGKNLLFAWKAIAGLGQVIIAYEVFMASKDYRWKS